MTTLAVYAAFLTARWDEAERHVEFVRDFIPDEGNQGEYIDPRAVRADLAAKRAVLKMALWQEVQAAEGWGSDYYTGRADGGLDRLRLVVAELAFPFRDHPDHPDHQETK